MKRFNKNNDSVIFVNKNFKRCILYIIFPIEEVDDFKLSILEKMAFDKSMNYDTDKKIRKVNINNYCHSYHGKVTSVGDSYFLEIAICFPSYNSLGKDVLADNLKFIKDIIYNPYLEDGCFPKRDIEDIKKIIKNKVVRNFKDVLWYYEYKNDKLLDERGYLSNEVLDNPSGLDKITSKDIYDLYKKIISGNPLIFLCGDVDENKARKEIDDILLDGRKGMVSFEEKYFNYAKNIPSKIEKVIEECQYKSGVFYNYKIKDIKGIYDMVLLRTVKCLISSSSSEILFDTLRKDNDLVYRCGAYSYLTFGSLTLWAFTSKKNIEVTEKLFLEVMEKISDIKFISEKLPLIKERAFLNDEILKEDIWDTLMEMIDKYIEYKEKSYYDYIKDITALEVKNFIDKKLILVSKYIGVGEEDE